MLESESLALNRNIRIGWTRRRLCGRLPAAKAQRSGRALLRVLECRLKFGPCSFQLMRQIGIPINNRSQPQETGIHGVVNLCALSIAGTDIGVIAVLARVG